MKLFDEIPEKIIISVSGGLDSASLFYLLCKYYPDTEVIVSTGVVKQNLKDAECARNIVSEMRKRFSNIGKHYEFDIDLEDPFWVETSENLFKDSTHNSNSAIGLSKHLQQIEGLKKIRKETNVSIFMNATTQNPNSDYFDKIEPGRSSNIIRSTVTETPFGGKIYSPFINNDKKFVANIYKVEGLDWLYPLTRSCIASAKETNNFEIECGDCYWCKEKAWAFPDYI